MKKVLNNKKKCIILISLSVLILLVIIMWVLSRENKNQINNNNSNKDNIEQDIIVHESDENLKEKQDEDGLAPSDSKDGPVLKDEQMINFNDSEGDNKLTEDKDIIDKADNKDENNSDSNEDDNNQDDEDEKDTGRFGIFY